MALVSMKINNMDSVI